MNNESYEDIHPEIERMIEDYLLLKRQGKAPKIEKFIQRYSAEHQNELRKELEAYEQLHLLFSALQQYQAEKIASELSDEQVIATYERFQQWVAATLHRKPVLAFIRLFKDYVKGVIATFKDVVASLRGREYQPVPLGRSTIEEAILSPSGKIRGTELCLRVTLQKDVSIAPKSVWIILVDDESDEILLQKKTEDILAQEGVDVFEIPLLGNVTLERGKKYRFEAYLDFEEDGTRKHRRLGESRFEVETC